MSDMLLIILASAGGLAFWSIYGGYGISNDGMTYILYHNGIWPAQPFNGRCIMSALLRLPFKYLGRRVEMRARCSNWESDIWEISEYSYQTVKAINILSLFVASVVLGSLFGPWASVLFIMSTYVRCLVNWSFYTIDHVSFMLAIVSIAIPSPYCYLTATLASLAGERAGVMLACWTLNPAFLLTAIPPVALRYILPSGQLKPWEIGVMDKQTETSLRCFRQATIPELIAPLGAFWLGVNASWNVVLSLAVAYGQMSVGNDKIRYFGWAIPALVSGISMLDIPPWSYIIIVAAHAAGHCFSDKWRA